MLSKTQVRKHIKKYFYNRNRTHYLKWTIDAEWSVRFIFTYDAKPEHNGTYVLKSHFKKIYITLTRGEALDYIHKYCDASPKEYFSLAEFGRGYRRFIVDPATGADCFIENKYRK